jgi:S1-C subfamily serine protease
VRVAIRSGAGVGTTVDITRRPFVIGRDAACDLAVDDEKVSRRHATLETFGDTHAILRDLESTNGTYVGDTKITDLRQLAPGEQFRVGDTVLEVLADAAPPPAPPAEQPAAAAPADPASQSTIRRLVRRSTRTQTIVAVATSAIALVLVVLLVAGVFSGGGSSAPASQPTVADVVRDIRPSTGLVVAGIGNQAISAGTGWVLDANQGLIVTNHHVVDPGNEFTVTIGGRDRPAHLVATAPCEDLAVLKVDGISNLRALTLGSQKTLQLGDTVGALGFPESASPDNNLTATTGVVSVVRTSLTNGDDIPDYPDVIQTDTPINPGNSGGPLVNLNHQLVGVDAAGSTMINGDTIQNENYAIGVDRVRTVVAGLAQGHSMAWTGLGLQASPAASDLAQANLPNVPGLLVTDVVPGTPAERTGLGKTPALVTAINGQPMDGTIPAYCRAVGSARSGSSATFSVIMAGQTTPVNVRVPFA